VQLRVQAMVLVLLSACAARSPEPTPTDHRSDAEPALAQLPALRVYEQADVYRAGFHDRAAEPALGLDGVLVRDPAGQQPLEPGDRLLVYQPGLEVARVTVTQARCPPGADNCLTCDTRWAERVAGPAIDWNNIAAIVGPIDAAAFEAPQAIADDWSIESGLIVTRAGVRLRQRRECTSERYAEAICETTTELVLGDATRELSRTSTGPSPTVPQVFRVFDRSGVAVPIHGGPVGGGATIGGGGQVVIVQWDVAPERPVEGASYWLLSSKGVVGTVRFDPPHAAAFCSLMSDLCWATTAIELPPPGVDVELVIGPIPEPAPAVLADVTYGSARVDARVGPPDQPWVVFSTRQFACHEDGPRWMGLGSCFETVTTTAELQQRRVSFLPRDDRPALAWTICVEHTKPE
jgi:hypothetical protein